MIESEPDRTIGIGQALRDQAPWIITFACLSGPSLLTHNSVVRLAGAIEASGYGLLLLFDYGGLARRRPWSGAVPGRVAGGVILIMGAILSAGAIVELVR